MADTPTDWSFYHNPLRVAVETAPGSRTFRDDPRIAVEKLVLGSNETPSEAMLTLYAGPIDSEAKGIEDALTAADVLNAQPRTGFDQFLGPDQEIMVFRDLDAGALDDDEEAEGAATREILLSGHCTSPRYDERSAETGGKARSNRGFQFLVRGMLDRLSETPHGQVYGRRMRTAAGQDELDAAQERSSTTPRGDADSVALVTAERCVFNADGKPNRAAAPISIIIGGASYLIHVFTADGDPDAEPWTFAQALRYLLMWHLFESQTGTVITELPGPIKDGNAFELTENLATLIPESRPTAPVAEADAFAYAMLAEARGLDCEGISLPEALILLADASSVRFCIRTESQTTDEEGNVRETALPVNRLYFYARGTGTERELHKEATFADRGLAAADLLAKTNVKDLAIQADYADVITEPVFLGDVKRYEVTVELVPGWEPDANLDDVADVDAALEFAEAHQEAGLSPAELQADPWFCRYHKGGASFEFYSNVGRRWVLNETGRYRTADYARSGGAFTADAYEPWEPTAADIADRFVNDDGNISTLAVIAGAWARKARPLQPCLSADEQRRSMGIFAEFSFNGGTTWVAVPAARIMNIDEEAGIYLDVDDLTLCTQPGDDDDGTALWEAMVRGDLRVRVTAVIEGDDRLRPNLTCMFAAPARSQSTSRVFDLAEKYQQNRRDAANSIFALTGSRPVANETTDARDDLEAIQDVAEITLELLSGRQNALSATIPWITTDYQVLNTVERITGINLVLQSHGAGRINRRTDIVAIEIVGAHTRLIFEDPRLLEQLEF